MEQVIRAYGRFLLEAAVSALLLVLLFAGLKDEEGNQGVFRMIGAQLDEAREESGGLDFAGFAGESRVGKPVIAYRYTGVLYTGSYPPEMLLGAVDAAGNEREVRVRSVTDPQGNEREPDAAGQLVFDTGGIYTLRVAAMDDENRVSTCEIRVPVNWQEVTE